MKPAPPFTIVQSADENEWNFPDAIRWLKTTVPKTFEYILDDLEVFTILEGETITLRLSTVDGMLLREWDLESPYMICYFESYNSNPYLHIPPAIRKVISGNVPELLKIKR